MSTQHEVQHINKRGRKVAGMVSATPINLQELRRELRDEGIQFVTEVVYKRNQFGDWVETERSAI